MGTRLPPPRPPCLAVMIRASKSFVVVVQRGLQQRSIDSLLFSSKTPKHTEAAHAYTQSACLCRRSEKGGKTRERECVCVWERECVRMVQGTCISVHVEMSVTMGSKRTKGDEWERVSRSWKAKEGLEKKLESNLFEWKCKTSFIKINFSCFEVSC